MDLSSHHGELPIPMASSTPPFAPGHDYHHHHHHHSNGPFPVAAAAVSDDMSAKKRMSPTSPMPSSARYKECLKNHAASIGGSATDGCGEFMPAGEDGSLEALRCSACGCHRNFHRKEMDTDIVGGGGEHAHWPPYKERNFISRLSPIGQHQKGLLLGYARPHAAASPMHHHHHMIMPLSAAAMQTSESDEMEGTGTGMGGNAGPMVSKKRFRTKFTPEQKERMLAFAERVGWRLQRLDDGVVQQFCQEVGVKRRVLKVWMHNNKHNLAKKSCNSSSSPPPPPQLPQPAVVHHQSLQLDH